MREVNTALILGLGQYVGFCPYQVVNPVCKQALEWLVSELERL